MRTTEALHLEPSQILPYVYPFLGDFSLYSFPIILITTSRIAFSKFRESFSQIIEFEGDLGNPSNLRLVSEVKKASGTVSLNLTFWLTPDT